MTCSPVEKHTASYPEKGSGCGLVVDRGGGSGRGGVGLIGIGNVGLASTSGMKPHAPKPPVLVPPKCWG